MAQLDLTDADGNRDNSDVRKGVDNKPSDSPYPERMEIEGLDDYLAAMSKMVFQAGMGRKVVDAKWNDIVAAFDSFDCEATASMSPDDVERLCGDERVIRNRRKIEAIVHNANALLEIEADAGFSTWLESQGDEDRERALRSRFKYLGPAGTHEFLWIVGASDEGCTT